MSRPETCNESATSLSSSDEWATPPELFGAASALWGPFTLDAAAAEWNSKCESFIGRAGNALAREWDGRVWLNPPYSRGQLDAFMGKARGEVVAGRAQLVTCLVPGHTAEGWWHRHVETPAGDVLGVGHEVTLLGPRTQVRFVSLWVETLRLRGRVRFVEAGGATGPARFPSVLVVFARPGVLPLLVAPGRAPRRGPPSKVTPLLAETMRRLLAEGKSLKEACGAAGVDRSTWFRHAKREAAHEA